MNWSLNHLAPRSQVLRDDLAYFSAVITAGGNHQLIVTGAKHPNDLPQFRWINTLFGNLKTSLSGTFHSLNLDKYARRHLVPYCFRFNQRFAFTQPTDPISDLFCGCRSCMDCKIKLS